MTANSFYMNVTPIVVEISVQEGRMKAEAEISIEDFAFALLKTNNNLDYLAEPLKKELIQRAENEWDLDTITDDDLAKFKKVLEWIL